MSPLRCICLRPAWSEQEPVTSLSRPLTVVANLCSSRAATRQRGDPVPSPTNHSGACPQKTQTAGHSAWEAPWQRHKPKSCRGRGGMKRTGGRGLRKGMRTDGARARRGQVLSGIPFHSGNSPASSVDSRLNLDVLVLEVGRGGEGTPASSQLVWVTP